jgi:hypothetical protein
VGQGRPVGGDGRVRPPLARAWHASQSTTQHGRRFVSSVGRPRRASAWASWSRRTSGAQPSRRPSPRPLRRFGLSANTQSDSRRTCARGLAEPEHRGDRGPERRRDAPSPDVRLELRRCVGNSAQLRGTRLRSMKPKRPANRQLLIRRSQVRILPGALCSTASAARSGGRSTAYRTAAR